MRHRLIPILILILLGTAAGIPGPAGAGRSPFNESPKQKSVYNYARAKKNCTIIGLIATQTQGRVILKLNEDEHASVYQEGDALQLTFRGISHRFTIESINSKSIRLRGGNNKNYVVEVR